MWSFTMYCFLLGLHLDLLIGGETLFKLSLELSNILSCYWKFFFLRLAGDDLGGDLRIDLGVDVTIVFWIVLPCLCLEIGVEDSKLELDKTESSSNLLWLIREGKSTRGFSSSLSSSEDWSVDDESLEEEEDEVELELE